MQMMMYLDTLPWKPFQTVQTQNTENSVRNWTQQGNFVDYGMTTSMLFLTILYMDIFIYTWCCQFALHIKIPTLYFP